MANINDLGRLIANAVKAGLQDVGGGGSGGAIVNSSNTVMPKPTFTNLTQTDGGAGVPPYGAQNVVNPPFANGGSQNGRPSFTGLAVSGLAGAMSLMPGATQANFVNYSNTRLAGMFPSGAQGQPGLFGRTMPGDDLTGRYNAASQFTREIARNSTITNPMDVYAGIGQLSYRNNFGIMGDVNASSFLQGAGAMSNLVPGAGFEKTATSLFNSIMQPSNQNRARMMGLSVTDPETGRPKDPRTIADQIWNRINNQKIGSSPITKEDIQRGLLPGRSLDSLLNQLIGDDSLARNIIASILIAKAMSGGASAYDVSTKSNLLKLGFTTEGMLSASNRAAADMGMVQSTARAETYGLSKANEAAGILAESLARLNALLGFASLPAVLAGVTDGIAPRAKGGSANSKNAYLVGEAGPELFIPNASGYVVSNNDLRMAGARHEGGFVHPHPHPEWSKSDLDSEGRLNTNKVKELLGYAGFKGSAIKEASQIIGAESARRPGAMGDKELQDSKWGPSIGLFQIRSLRDPGKYNDPMRNDNYLDDPVFNVMAGYEKSKGGTNWNAWTTAKGLGLSTSSGNSIVNTVNSSDSDGGGGFFSRLTSIFPNLFRSMSGSASGSVINYGGVKVEIIIPKGSSFDGKSLANDLERSLNDKALQNKARTQ